MGTSRSTHSDFRIRYGFAIAFGAGMIIPDSPEQKLNTRISEKAELVTVVEGFPRLQWNIQFQKYKAGL